MNFDENCIIIPFDSSKGQHDYVLHETTHTDTFVCASNSIMLILAQYMSQRDAQTEEKQTQLVSSSLKKRSREPEIEFTKPSISSTFMEDEFPSLLDDLDSFSISSGDETSDTDFIERTSKHVRMDLKYRYHQTRKYESATLSQFIGSYSQLTTPLFIPISIPSPSSLPFTLSIPLTQQVKDRNVWYYFLFPFLTPLDFIHCQQLCTFDRHFALYYIQWKLEQDFALQLPLTKKKKHTVVSLEDQEMKQE